MNWVIQMKNRKIIILVLLIAITMVACTTTKMDDDIAETFEHVIETEPTTPTETTTPTIPPATESTLPTEEIQEDITFTVELFDDNEDIMPYFLYIPSTRETSSEPIPLIIWLHGGDEFYCKYENMITRGLPAALENWGELDGFDAYIVCPQMTGKWKYFAGWQTETNRRNLDNILADVLARNHIDTEKIIISGHSIGGRGAITNALHNVNDFDYYKVVSISGFIENYDIQFIKELDIRFYTGKVATGEYEGIWSHNIRVMTKYFGEENLFVIDGSHANSPVKAFLLDEDGNNKSDLIEWMLRDQEFREKKYIQF